MADRHKHPPLYFRPAGDDRDWLAAHAAETGKKPGRILAEALSAYRAACAAAPEVVIPPTPAAVTVVKPRRASQPGDRPRCTHSGTRIIGGWCPQCQAQVEPGGYLLT